MPNIILIHGFGCDSRFWKPQVAALREFDLFVPDLPFHGGPTNGVQKTLEGLAEWVVETHLQSPAVLIGHSLGGMISLQIVNDHPELVQGLVLVDSFPSLKLNNQFLPGLYHYPMDLNVLEWIESTRKEIISQMTEDIYDEIWPSVHNFDATPWLQKINCPVLGIYGGRGRYTQDDDDNLKRDLMLDKIPAPVTVKILPQASHFVNLENPVLVNYMLSEWLDGV